MAINLIPRRGVIATSDDGVWPGSWRLDYGWPMTAYTEFGPDASSGMLCWKPAGLLANTLVAACLGALFFFLISSVGPRPVIPDS